MQKVNWLHALSNIGLGVVESAVRKQATAPTVHKKKKSCTPCEAKAFAAQLFNNKK